MNWWLLVLDLLKLNLRHSVHNHVCLFVLYLSCALQKNSTEHTYHLLVEVRSFWIAVCSFSQYCGTKNVTQASNNSRRWSLSAAQKMWPPLNFRNWISAVSSFRHARANKWVGKELGPVSENHWLQMAFKPDTCELIYCWPHKVQYLCIHSMYITFSSRTCIFVWPGKDAIFLVSDICVTQDFFFLLKFYMCVMSP